MQLKNPVLMASIGAPQGIKGEVRVKSFTDDPLAMGDYGSLWSADGRKFKVKRLRPHKNLVVVKFEGINSREEAQALNRIELFVDRSVLPDPEEVDEFYVADLIGLSVQDDQGNKTGVIKAVPDFGAGDLLEIAPVDENGVSSSKTWYLEFTKANVPTIDFDAGTVTIVIPDEISERDE